MSWWNDLCEREFEFNNITKEEQEAEYEDLIDYLRVWSPCHGDELAVRIFTHPNVDVRMQLRSCIYAETCREASHWDDLLDYIADVWERMADAEKDMNEPFETFEEALEWIQKEDAEKRKNENKQAWFDKMQQQDTQAREKKKLSCYDELAVYVGEELAKQAVKRPEGYEALGLDAGYLVQETNDNGKDGLS